MELWGMVCMDMSGWVKIGAIIGPLKLMTVGYVGWLWAPWYFNDLIHTFDITNLPLSGRP